MEDIRKRLKISREIRNPHLRKGQSVLPNQPIANVTNISEISQKIDVKRDALSNLYLGNSFNPNYINSQKGKKIIVCGCGNSIKYLNDTGDAIIIGVNDIERKLTPHYLLVVNHPGSFTRDRWSFVCQTNAEVVITQIKNLSIANQEKLVYINLGSRGGYNLENPDKIDFSNNSPYMGVILAYFLGASKIGIIGVDFTENHFFKDSGKHRLSSGFSDINKEYENLGKSLQSKGVEIANLSSESNLTFWPKTTISEFLKD